MTAPKHHRMLNDRNGVWVEPHAHVRVTHPRHLRSGQDGTVVRVSLELKRAWVAFPDGKIVPVNPRSLAVQLH